MIGTAKAMWSPTHRESMPISSASLVVWRTDSRLSMDVIQPNFISLSRGSVMVLILKLILDLVVD